MASSSGCEPRAGGSSSSAAATRGGSGSASERPAGPGATFRPHERLHSGAQFRRVFAAGFRLTGPLFTLVVAPNGLAHDRLGLAASRKIGGAVQRNRAKRLLRESFRRSKGHGLLAMDVVALPKPEILRCRQDEVEREYRQRLRMRARRTGARGPGGAVFR